MGRMKSEKDLALKLSRKLVEKGVCSTFRYARKEKLKNIVQKLSTNNPFFELHFKLQLIQRLRMIARRNFTLISNDRIVLIE